MTSAVVLLLFFEGPCAGSAATGTPETGSAVNIHYTGRHCHHCHDTKPRPGGPQHLKYKGDFMLLCKCHVDAPGSYLHPVDIPAPRGKVLKIPDILPLRNGKITCATCHDIARQCLTFAGSSLRGAPYQRRVAFCLNCHQEEQYRRLDPHDQVSDRGDMRRESCLYCHTVYPESKQASQKDLQLIGDPEVLCRRCHFISGNHSGNFNHMVKPSAKGLKRMAAMEKKYDLVLPLDIDGKMTCVTCHNPHEKGVIPVDRRGAKGADSKYRHRLPGRLCTECHRL